MGLGPTQYIDGKRRLLSEHARTGSLSQADARSLLRCQLDVRRAGLLWEYCVLNGWIKGSASSQAASKPPAGATAAAAPSVKKEQST